MSAVLNYAPQQAEAERLGEEIAELCVYLHVAKAHLLELIREFDEKRCWEALGFPSCISWLGFQCGIGANAAREHLRVEKLNRPDAAQEIFDEREVTYYYDDDGCLMMKAKIPAEQGELIVKALEMAMEEHFAGAAAGREPGDPESFPVAAHLENGPCVSADYVP